MTADEREPAIERLDADWERLQRGETTWSLRPQAGAESDPGLTATVRRLHALDASSAPPPRLAEAIWRNLMRASGANGSVVPLNGSPPAAPANERWSADGPERAVAEDPRFRWWPLIELAAVAAIILAVAGGVILDRRAIQRLTAPSLDEAGDDVPMFHGNPARTGVMPGPGPGGDPVVRWKVKTGNWEAYSSPAVVDGVVYAGSDQHGSRPGTLFAIDAATGAERWRFALAVGGVSDPAVVDGVVYVASVGGYSHANGAGGDLYALDAATGAERWRHHTGWSLSSPAVAGGGVYVGSVDGSVAAIYAATGELRWRAAVATSIGANVRTAPVVADGAVYVGVDPTAMDMTMLVALDADSGRERWRFAVTQTGVDKIYPWSPTGPAAADGVIFIALGNGVLYSVDAATGAERWHAAVGDKTDSIPAVAAGVAYVGSRDGAVVALDAATGAARWRLSLGGGPAAVNSSPVVTGGVVYVASNDTFLYAIGGTADAEAPPP